MKPTLFLMLGYPGSGKTTVAEMIARLTGAVQLSSDKIRLRHFPRPTFSEAEHRELYQAIDAQTEELLRAGKSVIYDANLNRYIHRQEKYDICKRTGATPVLIWIQTPQDLAKRRATQEADDDPKRPYGNLDEAVFDRLARQIEPPRDNENPIVIEGVTTTEAIVRQKLGLQ